MKGVILAAGKSSRLYPATQHISKALLPVFDKPMIYYPLTSLIQLGIKDILVITSIEDRADFYELLKNGEALGVNISYAVQIEKNGIVDALIIGKEFIGSDSVALALCDNIFLTDFSHIAKDIHEYANNGKATIFCKTVDRADVHKFGILEITELGNLKDIVEKPVQTDSNLAVTGLYIYPKNVAKKAVKIEPSLRGEREISDLNAKYLKEDRLQYELLGIEDCWFDAGTPESLLECSIAVSDLQKYFKTLYGSPELESAKSNNLSKTTLQRISVLRRTSKYYERLYELLAKTQEGPDNECMLELSKERQL